MKRLAALSPVLSLAILLSGCADTEYASHARHRGHGPSQGNFKVGDPYEVAGNWYYPKETYRYAETGIASWYGPGFTGKHTASGETYDDNELTAAHRTLQMPSLVRVTNLDNGRSVIVRVNDRGPYMRGRVMDVSTKAAELLGFKGIGTAKVRLDLLPQESLQIAAAAKAGLSTKGYEVAANNGTYLTEQAPYKVASADASTLPPQVQAALGQNQPLQDTPGETASVEPVEQDQVATAQLPASPKTGLSVAVPGHTKNGRFYPDPVVTEMPVTATKIYVQAGAFANKDNADHLSAQISTYGDTKVELANVKGKQLYRVRLGPVTSVDAGDALLSRVVKGGFKNSVLIVE